MSRLGGGLIGAIGAVPVALMLQWSFGFDLDPRFVACFALVAGVLTALLGERVLEWLRHLWDLAW